MTTTAVMPHRGRYHGMLQILRYNLPMYAVTAAGCLAVAAALALLPIPRPVTVLAALGVALAAVWSLSSLLTSHYIYDLSPLSRWDWLAGRFAAPPHRWVSLHAGLDETFGALPRIFPAAGGTVLDFYDPEEMTEPSIIRARSLSLDPVARRADFRALPFAERELDAVFLIFAAHELRRPESRLALFREVARVLAAEGRVVLVEHLRDLANFLAFGPGFLHFLSRREWLRLARESGLAIQEDLRLTPFVNVLVLERGV